MTLQHNQSILIDGERYRFIRYADPETMRHVVYVDQNGDERIVATWKVQYCPEDIEGAKHAILRRRGQAVED